MQGIIHGNHYVFLYSTMLHTRASLLKEIYCESHRFEPWAVYGSERRIGRYVFPNVLYIEKNRRKKILNDISTQLLEKPEFYDKLYHRFYKSVIRFEWYLFGALRGNHSSNVIRGLICETCKILSSGIFKEVFEYNDALNFLSHFIPVENLQNKVLALYQPQCIPHFLKFDLKMHFFAEKLAKEENEKWIYRCIDQCAHLSRFLIEDTPYHDPGYMKDELEKIIAANDGNPAKIKQQRLNIMQKHGEALQDGIAAEKYILQSMDQFAVYSLRSKIIVTNCIKFIRFIATLEELKHIFSVQTAWALREIYSNFNLDLEETYIQDLLELLQKKA